MQTNAATTGDNELAGNDLGPLAWVLEELKKSLAGATRAIRRFVRDAELARGSELAELDASQLRIARQQLHQAVGALEMVGFSAPAKVLRAMEALAQKFAQRPELCSDDAAVKVERAGFAVAEYLEGVLKGKSASSVALFPQYRDVLDLVGGERVHPADLWSIDWAWVDAAIPVRAAPAGYEPKLRTLLDQSVLRVVKTGEPSAAMAMRDAALSLAAGQSALEQRVFWKICAAFFEATGKGICATDVYAKRAASRVLLQYATLARGDASVSDRLAQDLLFFCAQAVPLRESDAPVLSSVRHAYKLDEVKPFDYETRQFGRFDPAVLVQARKRIATATETWSALAGGDTNRLKAVTDQFGAVGDSILKLHPESSELARALARAVEVTVRSGEPPTTPVAMEVATAVLYLEAAYEDMDPTDSQMGVRSKRLAQRLEHVIAAGQPEPLEGWMKDLYRRVSDRQTMGSVVDELRTTLGEVEKSLDQFFRQPQDKLPLHEVPSQLAQMRGVFSVLGLDQASLAALRMRDSVEKFLMDDVATVATRADVFEKLGSSLGALGFLIDMLSYQRVLAKKLFMYDEIAGEFRPVTGPEKKLVEPSVPPSVVSSVVPVRPVRVAQAPTRLVIEPVAGLAPPRLATPPSWEPAAEPTTGHVAEAFTAPVSASLPISGLMPLSAAPPRAVPVAVPVNVAAEARAIAPAAVPGVQPAIGPAAPEILDDDESEIRDIFLEEAREVVQTGLAAVSALGIDASVLGEQATLRRAFHTLKGSSRMVGLNEFGEAAWSMEQLLNSWLAEQKPASEALVSLSGKALSGFRSWVEDIATGADARWSAKAIREAADALRVDKRLIALRFPGSVDDAVVSAPAHETAAALPVDLLFEEAEETPQAAFQPAPLAAAAAQLPVVSEFLDTSLVPGVDAVEFGGEVEAQDSVRPDFVATETFDPQATQIFGDAAPAEVESGLTLDLTDLGRDDFDFSVPTRKPEFEPTGFHVGQEDLSPDALADRVLPQEVQFVDSVVHDSPVPEHGFEAAPVAEHAEYREDPVKIIGPLRIGIPLYNVYLNEADEWSRRLLTELSEWSMELHRPVADSTVALAHSLAGSSATVGFVALSDIARSLEQALQHVQLHGRSDAHHAQVFSYAAEDIRRLLHQFAAGFLKEPDSQILDALKTISQTDFAISAPDVLLDAAPSQPAGLPELVPSTVSAFAPIVAEPGFAADPQVIAERHAAPPVQLASVGMPEPVRPTPTLPAATLNIAPALPLIDDRDDDIDLADALDADLFPIFEEEALELMPRLGGALRQWSARPDNLAARNEVLRVLHTLKGSARLAGGMRLGEMTHRLESAIEQLGSESLQTAQLEPLLARFDAIQANFEALRAGPEQAMVLPEAVTAAQAAPVAAPGAKSRAPAVHATTALAPLRQIANTSVRVRSQLLDRLVNQAGEVMITRSRLASRLGQLRGSLVDLSGNLDRLRSQLRDIEVQSESQMQSRMALAKDSALDFDPLEFDRFTRVQELTRMMAESVNDVATVQRNLQRTVEGTEDDLIAQGRQARELQRDLLRTRMVEFEGISERLYGVVRQAAKDVGKQVRLDITGGSMDIDRGVLERMAPAFEHLLRNSVAHGIEYPEVRAKAGKAAVGTITINLVHQSNEVSVEFTDDGAGLDLQRIREKAISSGVAPNAQAMSDAEVSELIFAPGFTTASGVTELSGRGIGMDVVRSEVNALGGRIETSTQRGQGTRFKLVLPLTTAVTQVVMLRLGELVIGVAANVIEIVRRVPAADLELAYRNGEFTHAGEQIPFFWAGALLQASSHSEEATAKNLPVAVFRSAGQRVAVHVDEVLGNQEVVVKNLGPQLSRLPGLTGMSVLASGAVVLIYNPVALASVYGVQAGAMRLTAQAALAQQGQAAQSGLTAPTLMAGTVQVPLVMVVDDSITVRRVTQRLLKREGYRVVLAADGLQALERLQDEKPTVVLSDIEMPRMDGFDLARNIRSDPKLRDLPIIMITSRIAEKHREHARELGVDHYLGKPYSEDELMGLVRHYCNAVIEI